MRKQSSKIRANILNNVVKFPAKKITKTMEQMIDADDKLDLNEYITEGQKGLMLYRINGASCVPEIKRGYLVIVDETKKPQLDDITMKIINEKNYIHQYIGEGFSVIAHFAVYRDLEVSE